MATKVPADVVSEGLRQLIDKYGRSLVDDPARLRGLLRDIMGDHRLEISLLIGATEIGVASELARGERSTLMPARKRQLATRLESERGISPENAIWAVDAWASALEMPPLESVAPAEDPIEPDPVMGVEPEVPRAVEPVVTGAIVANHVEGGVDAKQGVPDAIGQDVPHRVVSSPPPPPFDAAPHLKRKRRDPSAPGRNRRSLVVAAVIVGLSLVAGGITWAARPSDDGSSDVVTGEISEPPAGESVLVPPVVGQPREDAIRALEEAGFVVSSVTPKANRAEAPKTVLRQRPAAGASVAPGSSIELIVAAKPESVGAPTQLRFTTTTTTVTIKWRAPKNGGKVSYYAIERDGKRIGKRASGNRVFTDGGRTPGRSYTYKVIAIGWNGTRDSSRGRLVTLKEQPAPPDTTTPSTQPPTTPPEACGPSNLSACTTEKDCEEAGGSWFEGRCYASPRLAVNANTRSAGERGPST